MDKNLQRMYLQANAWGMEVALDLLQVDLEIIQNPNELRRYCKELVERIDMKAYGETQLAHFGSDEKVQGYTMVQMIETSLISGHFAELSKCAYINIFSCKPFDVKTVCDFSVDFFKAKDSSMHLIMRKGISV